MPTTRFAKERQLFRQGGGLLRTSAALRAGIHPRTLYEMRDKGIVEQLDRGLFRLASLPRPANPDLMTVAAKIPTRGHMSDFSVCLPRDYDADPSRGPHCATTGSRAAEASASSAAGLLVYGTSIYGRDRSSQAGRR
jgi:hypothetical protein